MMRGWRFPVQLPKGIFHKILDMALGPGVTYFDYFSDFSDRCAGPIAISTRRSMYNCANKGKWDFYDSVRVEEYTSLCDSCLVQVLSWW